ncbi:hypothetical protein C6341_g9084 [Phytophthora cactorum]|nr:hypothetical protein C6341_g9084 [Phytophthora cactorum]
MLERQQTLAPVVEKWKRGPTYSAARRERPPASRSGKKWKRRTHAAGGSDGDGDDVGASNDDEVMAGNDD